MAEEKKTTVKIETLGCKLNFSETATISALLAKRGITPAQDGDVPSVCVVNTCSVTELADKKCRQHIRGLIKRYPDALMVVTGCYAQLKSQEIAAIDGVDIVLGSEQKLNIADYVDRWLEHHQKEVAVTPHKDIRQFSPSCERGDRTRYWLKVQDGCDYFCTYCTIPMARGRSRSGTIESLVAQAREVAAEGGKEIVITGVNIGDFGKNTGERFIDLLRAFDEIKEIERYRISSIEPNLLSDEIIDWIASGTKFQKHFHIPLQSGSDEILKKMGRRYDTALFSRKIDYIRSRLETPSGPRVFFGIDVMVGLPGESRELFEQSKAFIESIRPAYIHVFPYSRRPGTPAASMDGQVDEAEKKRRVAELEELCARLHNGFVEENRGVREKVLFESSRKGAMMEGYTGNYIRVSRPYDKALVNTLVDIIL